MLSQKQKIKKPIVKGELCSIQFVDSDFGHFGAQYSFKVDGTTEIHENEYLVHFPSLIRLANEFGLAMLEIINLTDFLDAHKKNYGEQLKTLKVYNKEGKIEDAQRDIIGLNAAFVFQKTQEGEVAHK